MRIEQFTRPRGLLLRGLVALVCALTACTSNSPGQGTNDSTKASHAQAVHGEAPLAHFRGTVDVEHGTITFESLAPPKDLARWGGKDSNALRDVVVIQDGKVGSGPANSVELVTTRTSKDGAECGASDRFCGEVAIRSFYAVPLHNVWVELDAMAPESGFEAYNSSTTVPAGLRNRYGLFSYGDLEAKGGSNTARWGFNLAKGSGRKSFTFTGRVMAELTSSTAPIAEAGPDQHVFNGDVVQLNGSGSSDPQNGSLTYNWTLVSKPAGSTATLAQATTSTPTFSADLDGDYVVELVVNNGVEDSAPDTVTVTSVFRNTLSVTSLSLRTSDSGSLTVTLGSPALPGGQTVNLASNNSTVASVPASVFIPAGTRSATVTATSGTQSGSATITAFAPDFFDGTGSVHVSNRRMALSLPSSLVGVNRELIGTLTLTDSAPAAGVTVNLSTNANNVATISPASITFAAGQATATFTVTGLAEGQATFSAQAIGYNNATVNVSVTASSIISIPGNTVVAPDQTLSFPVSISTPAPAGGLTVQLTSSAPGVVSVTPSVVIPEGATTPSTQPTVTGVTLGSATITATGTGYAPDTRTVDVRMSMNLSPTSISVLVDNTNTLVLSLSAPAPAGGVTVDLRTDNAARATVPATVTFAAGQSQADVVVTGVTAGTTTLRATGVGLNEATAAITVNPAPALALNSAAVGRDLVTSSNGSLAAPAPAGNLQVTITSADPSKVLLATASGAAGSGSITLQVGAGNSSIPTFYIYALDGSGTVQLTATAPGYANGTTTVTLRPSGFIISSNNFTTTALSANTGLAIGTAMLDPTTLASLGSQALRPGISASVPVTSSDAIVGVITSSPVAFAPGEYQKSTAFDPIGGGTATIAVTQPAGFTAPSSKAQITATVTAPNITVYNDTIGKNLQTSTYVSLGTAAPTGGVAVTVTVADPTKALLSTSATTVGTSSLTFNIPAGTSNSPGFYIQALEGSGTVQYTATAPGYTGKTGTITLRPSGVMMSTCVVCSSAINTTTFSNNSNVSVFLGRLNPTTLNYEAVQALRPGVGPVSVDVTSSDPTVGTVTVSPVVINTNQTSASTAFDPVSAGTTTLAVNTPAGFSTPGNYKQITATVSAPDITVYNDTVGKDLQTSTYVSLGTAAPAGNAQVTITVADPTKALLSTSATTVGTSSLTFTVFAGSSHTPSFYIQALEGSGTVQYTASAPGYTSKTGTITLRPSGVMMSTCVVCGSAINTTTFSNNSNVSVFLGRLNPTTLNYEAVQALRPGVGPVSVDVTSSNTGVGIVTASPLVINTNQTSASTTFDPVSAGTTTLAVNTPAGFSTPGNYKQITATVSAPDITVYNETIGKNLQTSTYVSLATAAPTGGTTVTVTVADPTKALLSTSATTVGTSSLTLTVPAGNSYTPSFYLQALEGSGTVQYTASAPGYNTNAGTITLRPSGVMMSTCVVCGSAINTTTFSNNSNVAVFLGRLNPATLNYEAVQALRPGVGPVSVDVTSSDPTVGTVTVSPVVINTNQTSASTAFDPVSAGTTTLAISTPALFSAPSNYQQITATVTAPNITVYNDTVGKDLQTSTNVSLATAAPAGGTTVTVTVADPTKALLSTSATTVGTSSLTFNVPAGNSYTPSFYIQALEGSGTVQYTASAPGYNTNAGTITLRPSGVMMSTCVVCGSAINTASSSNNSNVAVFLGRLNPTTLNYEAVQALRPGVGSVSVNLANSNPTVGTLLSSALVINTNQTSASTAFDPVNGGTTTLTLDTPAGFTTPGNYKQIVVTVTAPDITGLSNLTIGKDLQVSTSASLGAAAPTGGTVLTITVDDTKARLSTAPDVLGTSGTLSFTIPAGSTYTPTFYVQALVGSGSVQWTATATGYNSKTSTLTFYPSGFVVTGFGTTFSTTLTSSDTTLNIHPAALDPFTLNLHQTQQLRPGLSNVPVSVTSSDTTVGTITLSPVVFTGADVPNYRTTSFHPVGVGNTTIVVSGPAGFSQASNNNNITAYVTN